MRVPGTNCFASSSSSHLEHPLVLKNLPSWPISVIGTFGNDDDDAGRTCPREGELLCYSRDDGLTGSLERGLIIAVGAIGMTGLRLTFNEDGFDRELIADRATG